MIPLRREWFAEIGHAVLPPCRRHARQHGGHVALGSHRPGRPYEPHSRPSGSSTECVPNNQLTFPPAPSLSGLIDSCRDCANSLLQFLKDLKFQSSLPGANPSAVRYTVQRIHSLGEVRRAQPGASTNLPTLLSASPMCPCVQELRPKGQDVRIEELGSMVDNEMIATSTAIEEAVLRMDVRTRSSPSMTGRSAPARVDGPPSCVSGNHDKGKERHQRRSSRGQPEVTWRRLLVRSQSPGFDSCI